MGLKETKFLRKKRVSDIEIMYMTREGRKSVIHMSDGRKVDTFHTLKGLIEDMPPGMFECINKGIVISSRFVAAVDNNEYKMADGTVFKGRARVSKDQKSNAEKYNDEIKAKNWAEYAILDNLPLPFCVIELMFDEKSHAVDFLFRYCNKEMEVLEGKTIDQMIDHSFYEVFKNGDKKWLVTYADIALNGGKRVIESYSPEIDANLRVYCYQPKPNFCACCLMPL